MERVSPWRAFKHIVLGRAGLTARSPRCTSSATSPISPPPVKVIFDGQLVQPRRRREGDRLPARPVQSDKFLEQLLGVEKAMVESGSSVEQRLEVDEQTRRLQLHRAPPQDLEVSQDLEVVQPPGRLLASSRWDAMFEATDTPWFVADNEAQAWPAQHHPPPLEPGALRAAPHGGHEAAEALTVPGATRALVAPKRIPTPF